MFTLPESQGERIWTITKTSNSLSIDVDGEEIVDYEFPDGTECKDSWSGDVGYFAFMDDTASDEYRVKSESQQFKT